MQSKRKKKSKSYNLNKRPVNHKLWWGFLGFILTVIFWYGYRIGTEKIGSFEKSMAISGIVVFFVFLFWLIEYSKAIDKASKKYIHGKEMGSARWEDVEEFNAKLKKDIENENMILSRNARKKYDKETLLNNNVTVVGGSGAGKTAGLIIPNLLQFYGCNLYIDPKGDTLRDFGSAILQEGIPLKVLDLCDMSKSLQYNPFKYITEDIHIDQLINNIIANTSPKDASKGDPFWEKSEILCSKALFFYIWLECPQPYFKYTQYAINDESTAIEVCQRRIYKTPIRDVNGKQRVLTKTIRSLLLLIGEAEVKEDEDELSDLDCRILVLKDKMQKLGKQPEEHQAIDNYNRVMRGAKDTVRSIVISVNARFVNFQSEKLLRIFDDDELELETMGIKKQNLFLIIPDEDTTFNFVVGMLYTQLFQTLYRTARKHNNMLPIPTGIWADEFANVKMPPDFEKILATCRSRQIYIVIILQSLAQLKTLYPNDAHEGILGNCDTFIYLGGNEKSSHKYVSEVLGKWTIDKRTNNQTLGKQGSVSVNNDLLGRELLMEDEVAMLSNKECIIKVRGFYPVRDQKAYWFQMEEYEKYKNLPKYESPVVVKKEGNRYITVKYKSPYTIYSEKQIREYEQSGQVNQIHPIDLLMHDLIEEKLSEQDYQKFMERGVSLYQEIDLDKLDENIKSYSEKEKKKQDAEIFSILMEESFTDEQMEVIIEALQEGVSWENIFKFAVPEKSPMQMRLIKNLAAGGNI